MQKPGLVDSHIHFTDFPQGINIPTLVTEASTVGVSHFVCNGTCEEDWLKVRALSDTYPQIVPCFGLHPWFVERASVDWLLVLESLIRENSNACVGEAGLDRLTEQLDRSAQEAAFEAQLRLAVVYDRPIMVHCVRAWGWMIDILRRQPRLPRVILFHAFAGSADIIKPLAGMGAYFSFSATVLNDNFKKVRLALPAVPRDRLLIETDAPNMIPSAEHRRYYINSTDGIDYNHPANLAAVLSGISNLLNEPESELRERLWRNSKEFLGTLLR